MGIHVNVGVKKFEKCNKDIKRNSALSAALSAAFAMEKYIDQFHMTQQDRSIKRNICMVVRKRELNDRKLSHFWSNGYSDETVF